MEISVPPYVHLIFAFLLLFLLLGFSFSFFLLTTGLAKTSAIFLLRSKDVIFASFWSMLPMVFD